MSAEETTPEKIAESYLVFSLGDEIFGTNLLSILEVMKMPSIKPVPYMVSSFKGVLNLRGQIVGVVDLRTQFDIKPKNPNQGMVLIVETKDAPIGAIVDDLISVESISETLIDHKPVIETKVPSGYLTGVAKLNERLMTLIDISGCLAATEMRAVKTKGKAA